MDESKIPTDPSLNHVRLFQNKFLRLFHKPQKKVIVIGKPFIPEVTTKQGGTYIKIVHSNHKELRWKNPEHVEIIPEETPGILDTYTKFRRAIIGDPIPTKNEIHQRLDKILALAIFSSDAISSVAYGPEQVMLTLMLAGTSAMSLGIPVTLAIAVLVLIVAISYRQTIHAYPSGGGSFIVAHDNLGILPGLTAASSLLIDYVLTVAVSIAAGVSALVSVWPELSEFRILLGLLFITVLVIANLRGLKDSGKIFALPTYAFILSVITIIVIGFMRTVFLHQHLVIQGVIPAGIVAEPLTLWLILRAFSSGSATLTGIEAVSNGVPAFKPPESKNASVTLMWMAGLLSTMAVGIAILAIQLHAMPSNTETMLSQIGRTILGGTGLPYLFLQASTMLILVLAANTSFADFPRLSSILARERFMPHQFSFRGDKLAFSNGIIVLGIIAGIILFAFGGSEQHLIPLYAVGVFLSFTLSQFGMVKRWWIRKDKGWRKSMLINFIGACTTALVLIIIAVTKFSHGAWMVIVIIPVLILMMKSIHDHYHFVEKESSVSVHTPRKFNNKIIIPVSGINRNTLYAVDYARSLASPSNITVVHVTDDAIQAEKMQQKWQQLIPDIHLVILESPFRTLIDPLLSYIESVRQEQKPYPVTVMVADYQPVHWWEHILHAQTSLRLRANLMFKPGIITTHVHYRLHH